MVVCRKDIQCGEGWFGGSEGCSKVGDGGGGGRERQKNRRWFTLLRVRSHCVLAFDIGPPDCMWDSSYSKETHHKLSDVLYHPANPVSSDGIHTG